MARFHAKLKSAESGEVTEAQRFYRQGERLRQSGDLMGARRVWQDLVAVFKEVAAEQEWIRRRGGPP